MSKRSEWILCKTQKVSLIVEVLERFIWELLNPGREGNPHPIPFNKFVPNRNLQKPDYVDFVI